MGHPTKTLCLLAALTLLFVLVGCGKKDSGQTEARSNRGQEPQPYVTTGEVAVRSGPGTQHQIVAEIKRGTKVNVAGGEGEWLKVVSKRGNPPGYIEKTHAQAGPER